MHLAFQFTRGLGVMSEYNIEEDVRALGYKTSFVFEEKDIHYILENSKLNKTKKKLEVGKEALREIVLLIEKTCMNEQQLETGDRLYSEEFTSTLEAIYNMASLSCPYQKEKLKEIQNG